MPGVEIGCGYFFPVGRSLLGLTLSAFKALLPTDIYDLEYNEVRCSDGSVNISVGYVFVK